MIPLPELGEIVAISLLCAIGVWVVGLAVLRLARRTSVGVQLGIVVAGTVASVATGTVVAAQAMLLSPHDLTAICWIVGASGAASLGVAVLLGRGIARSGQRLGSLVRALGDGTELPAGEHPADSAEFGRLSDELAATSRRLDAARVEVAAMESSRRELIAWISHDLRTPLAGLRAMSEALEDGLAEDPVRYHHQMRSQVDRLSAMVDDLFELSKIRSGTVALAMEPVPLDDLVSDGVAELGHLARSRAITLVSAHRAGASVVGDARELARVVGNLLMNAIQHSPPGSEIAVSTERATDREVVLTIQDAGGGIPEEHLTKVFEAGWRAEPARTPDPEWGESAGAGLGLAIVQGIVQAHSGRVSVRNVPGGCRVDVRLPRHQPAVA